MREALRFENITKKFGDVIANEDVSFSVEKGKIYSILGENGSGKTTLMNVVAGLYKQDSGNVYINGELAHISSPSDAFDYHVAMIHQHFKLVDVFSAVENVAMGLKRKDNSEYKVLKAEEKELGTFSENKKQYKTLLKKITKNLGSLEVNQLELDRVNENLLTLKALRNTERKTRFYSLKTYRNKMKVIMDRYGFQLDCDKKVYDMSVGEKQTLEIIKALNRGADTLILDEPTAVLTPQETEHLFKALRNMSEHGNTIIIITHKLNEVMEISDKVVILRKGKFVGEVSTKEASETILTELMVGKKVKLNIDRTEPINPKDRLIVENLTVLNQDGRKVVNDVSFTAKAGEILGIAGISNNGQKELLESISGLYPISSGSITLINPKRNEPVTLFHKKIKDIKDLASKDAFHYPNGDPVDLTNKKKKEIFKLIQDKQIIFNENEVIRIETKSPLQIRRAGIHLAFVPEDRLGMGLVGDMSITDNMLLRSYKHGKGLFVERQKPSELADKVISDLSVSTPSKETHVRLLSGGNIQKVLVGREIAYAPKVFMTAYPVRGLDINSSYTIYNLLEEQKRKGVAVIYVGEDLDVLLALCDRIMVLSKGEIAGIFKHNEKTKNEIGLLMTNGAIKNENAKN